MWEEVVSERVIEGVSVGSKVVSECEWGSEVV